MTTRSAFQPVPASYSELRAALWKLIRTVCDILNGTSSDAIDYVQVRGIEDGIKIAEVEILDSKIRAAVAHGLGNARKLIERVKAGEKFDFIEIMACPGGASTAEGSRCRFPMYAIGLISKKKSPGTLSRRP